jgi:excinuclease ABC subunit A
VASESRIVLEGVRTHNLKGVDVSIPHAALTAISGVSGSGKSSLAFDTLYAEGQRRFVESLSTYARQFLRRMEKPPLESVRNLLPAVALQQKNTVKNARSTVATLTEIADHLQLVFAHVGVTTCPDCGQVVQRETAGTVSDALAALPEGTVAMVVADVAVLSIQTPAQVLEEIAADGYRRLWVDGAVVRVTDAADVPGLLERDAFPVIVDRLTVRPGEELRFVEAAEAGFRVGRDQLRIVVDGQETRYSAQFACNACHRSFTPPIPQLFSFNTPIGACPTCSGFGRTAGLDMSKVVANPRLSLESGAIAVFASDAKSMKSRRTRMIRAARKAMIATDVPFRDLPAADRDFVLEGGKGWGGVRGYFATLEKKRYRPSARIMIARYRGYTKCPDCQGSRLSQDARCVTLSGHHVASFLGLTVRDARVAFRALAGDDVDTGFCAPLSALDREKVEPLLEELVYRVSYLDEVGLGYLTLDRQSRTLSGGEVQRIHLTSSLGRMLSDTLYVLDEPTAGLHARDTERLLAVLRRLSDIGNAVVVVEHDPDIIRGSDWVIELGPLGGERGGEILFEGDVAALETSETPTGRSLRQRIMDGPSSYRFELSEPHLSIAGARENNLQDVSVQIPLRRLTCVTGVSGSGKSTLVHKCLHDVYRGKAGTSGVELAGFEQVTDVVLMRQGGLGRSGRSNVATYTKAWDAIRKLYGSHRDARAAGLGPGDFSFNRPGGRCETCEGIGTILVEMHFMADIEVVCEVCEGRRFGEKALGIAYLGKSIFDVLNMTVSESLRFFDGKRTITSKLSPLAEVGLGYLRLGQTTSTLSGGEAQRLMLAGYLGGRSTAVDKGVLFVFDEPTVGLHLSDVDVLLGALRRVIDEGHTVVCVEHNIDFIARSDHVVDLGPDGGDGGGLVVAQGPPHEVAKVAESWTGRFLAEVFPAP